MNQETFFKTAFQRNIGLTTPEQQDLLAEKSVGIVGLGGVGGAYALSLVRIGIGKLVIADFDQFEIANMNRQAGATSETLGRPKAEVIREMALAINPFLQVEIYSQGVDGSNVDSFVNSVDVVIDAVDFYCIDIHSLLHNAARKANRYSLFSIPLGFSATFQVFSPRGMSFEDYFCFSDCADFFEKVAAFAVGAAPKGTHWSYMNVTGQQLADGNPPSLNSSVNLCTGVMVSSVLLILTQQWSEQHSAPRFFQLDSRKMALASGKLHWGNRGPLQKLKRWLVARRFSAWRMKINERNEAKQKTFVETTKQAV